MKKTVSAILMTILLLSSVLCTGAYAADGFALGVSSVSGARGDKVTVTVDITSNPGIAVLNFGVIYDESVLELTGSSCSGLSDAMFGGKYIWVDAANTTYTGTILTLTFRIRDDAPLGESTITLDSPLDVGNFDEERLPCTPAVGTVTVTGNGGETASPTAVPQSEAETPTAAPQSEAETQTGTPQSEAETPTGAPQSEAETPTGAPQSEAETQTDAPQSEAPAQTPAPAAAEESTAADSGETAGGSAWLWIAPGAVCIALVVWLILSKRRKDGGKAPSGK